MVRVRFAPSPSGSLHIGSARTAIVNYLYARAMDGKLILRIEDTDQERSTEKSVADILSTLRWVGISWDEGPFHQKDRFEIYTQYLSQLLSSGKAYKCFCKQEELEEKRKQRSSQGKELEYDGRCGRLTEKEISEKEQEGASYAYRLKMPDIPLQFMDLIKGQMEFQGELFSDMILVRSDGTPTYNFAVVIDDHLMGITHIIRGEDHLANTPKQIALYEALGWELPNFAHIPLILGPDKTKLSKRHCDTAIEDYREKGYLPETIFNYLALLGYSHDPNDEIRDSNRLIREFSLDSLSKSPSQFDIKKLTWMNSQCIKMKDPALLWDEIKDSIKDIPLDEGKKRRIFNLSIQQTKTLNDFKSIFDPFLEYNLDTADPRFQKLMQNESVSQFTAEYMQSILALACFDEKSLEQIFNTIQAKYELSQRDSIQSLRFITTGSFISPPLFDTMAIIGRDEIDKRYNLFLREITND